MYLWTWKMAKSLTTHQHWQMEGTLLILWLPLHVLAHTIYLDLKQEFVRQVELGTKVVNYALAVVKLFWLLEIFSQLYFIFHVCSLHYQSQFSKIPEVKKIYNITTCVRSTTGGFVFKGVCLFNFDRGGGGTPNQNSTVCTCYTAGGIPSCLHVGGLSC